MNRQPVISPNFHHYPAQHFHDPALASVSALSYRSFQLPHRTAELPAGYNPTPLPPRPPAARMSYQQMAADDELAQLQKLSNEYQPEATVSPRARPPAPERAVADSPQGPLVGPRQSTAAITTEYANGDPVYRAKTQVRVPALPARLLAAELVPEPSLQVFPLPNVSRRWTLRVERYAPPPRPRDAHADMT